MAEPLLARSIAAIVDLISITLSIIATLYSSAYNNERVLRGNRQAGDEFDQLAKCLRLLSDHKQPSRTQLKALSEREQVACWTLLQQTPSAAACLPPSFRDMTYIPDSVALARYMHRITAHCQEQTRHTPVFWRLQSWIPKTATGRLPSPVRHWFARFPLERPVPHGLLLSWVVLPVAIAIYCRSRAGFRNKEYYLVCSMALACVIGMLESSDRATVILMDIPWCLTMGMILHVIVRGSPRRLSTRRIPRKISCGPPPMALSHDVEKIAGNDDDLKRHGAQRGRAVPLDINNMKVQLHRWRLGS